MPAGAKPAAGSTTASGVKFAIGGLSGMGATLFVQPLDLVKTRMQLQTARTGTATVLVAIARQEGVWALYSGYARQACTPLMVSLVAYLVCVG
jgi:solute carrier family 25 (mitochondrial oxoglutarate transporter), member 11